MSEPGSPWVNPTTTVVYVTAEGVPEAWVANGREVEVHLTPPGSTVEAAVVIPLADAMVWAADVYAAVTIACRDHLAEGAALSDDELAGLPDPGRLIVERLAQRWADEP